MENIIDPSMLNDVHTPKPKLRIGNTTEEDLKHMSRHELLNFRLTVEENIRSIKDQLDKYTGGNEEWYRRSKYALKCNRAMAGKICMYQAIAKDHQARLFMTVAKDLLSDSMYETIWKEVKQRENEERSDALLNEKV